MTLNITRRQALKVTLAALIMPTVLPIVESELVNVDDFTPSPYGDPCSWSPQQVCHVFAAWELSAQQNNLPDKWRRLRYDGAFQWSDGRDGSTPLIAWYGIGPPSWTADRLDSVLKFLDHCDSDTSVLAWERIARGRAFAVVSSGRLSQRARYELAKPACRRSGIAKAFDI